MTNLTRLLKEADGSEARFSSTDISQRIAIRRRRRSAIRALATIGVFAVAIGVITTITNDADDTRVVSSPESSTTTASHDDGSSPVTLVGNDWSLLKASGVSALGDRRVRISFASDGTLRLDAGCGLLSGTWKVRNAMLATNFEDISVESCDDSTAELHQLVISRLSGPVVINFFLGYADTVQLGPTEQFLAFQRVSAVLPVLPIEVKGVAVPGSNVTIVVNGLDKYRGEELDVTMETLDGFAYLGVSVDQVDANGTTIVEIDLLPPSLVHEGPCRDIFPCDLVDVTDGLYRLTFTPRPNSVYYHEGRAIGSAEFWVGPLPKHLVAPGMKEVVYRAGGAKRIS